MYSLKKKLFIFLLGISLPIAFGQASLIFSTEEDGVHSPVFILDSGDTSDDFIDLEFGSAIDAKLRYDVVNDKFNINRNIDIEGNELIDVRVENLSGAPTCAVGALGRFYYDTTLASSYVCEEIATSVYAWVDVTVSNTITASKIVTVGTGGNYSTIAAAAQYLNPLTGGIILLTPELHLVDTAVDIEDIRLIGSHPEQSMVRIQGNGVLLSKDSALENLSIEVDASLVGDVGLDVKYDSSTTSSMVFEWVDIVTATGKALVGSTAATPPELVTRFESPSAQGGVAKVVGDMASAGLDSASLFSFSFQGDAGVLDVSDWDVSIAGASNVRTSGVITTTPADTIFVYPDMDLQGALASLDSGGSVTLLPGVHSLTSPLVVDKDNISILGYGEASVIEATGFAGITAETAAVQIGLADGTAPVNDILLQNFKVEVNNTDIHGIRVTGGQDIRLFSITVEKTAGTSTSGANAKLGMLLTDSNSAPLVRPVVKNSQIRGASGRWFTDGIHISGEGAVGGLFGNGNGVQNALLESTSVDYVGETAAAFVHVSDSSLFNNRFSQMGGSGGSSYGVYIGRANRVTMANNIVSGSLSNGSLAIGIESFNIGADPTTKNSTFSGNTVDGMANGGVGFGTGFQIGAGTGTRVEGNVFIGNTFTGASPTTTTAVIVRGDFDNNILSNNDLSGGVNNWDTGVNIQNNTAENNYVINNFFENVTTRLLDLGLGTKQEVQKYVSTANPTVTDDVSNDYVNGMLWVNTTSDEAFILVDETIGAAVWKQIDGSGGGAYTAGAGIDITGTVVSADLGTDIDSAEIVDGAVATIDVANDAITTDKIGTTGAGDADKVLTTDASGNPVWEDKSVYTTPALTSGSIFVGNASNLATGVSMTGDATISNTGDFQLVADSVTASEIATSAVTTTEILDGTVATIDVADDAITTDKIGTSGAGDADKVLTTDASGNPQWELKKIFELKLSDDDGNTLVQVEEGSNDDTIRFDTAGVERMIITPTGQLAIGTTTPSGLLNVHSDTGSSVVTFDTNVDVGSGNNTALFFQSDTDGTPNPAGLGQFNDGALRFTGAGNLVNPDLIIVDDGDVGIGTDTPSDASGTGGEDLKLDIEGAVGAARYCDENGENCYTINDLATTGGTGKFVDGVDPADAAYITGNVGVGTNDPQRALHLRADSAGTLTAFALENADTTNNNGNVVSFRTTTTGTGGADFQEMAGFVTTYREHDHATRASDIELFAKDEGANPGAWSYLTLKGDGGVGIGTRLPSDGTANGGEDLMLDVDGALGSAYYCDEDGENCYTIEELSGDAIEVDLPSAQFVQTASFNMNANTTDNLMPWDTVDFAETEIYTHSPTINNSRVQVEESGKYLVTGGIALQGANVRYNGKVKFRVNGTTTMSQRFKSGYIRSGGGQDETSLMFSMLLDLNTGDYFELLVDREGGSANAVSTSPGESSLSIVQLRALETADAPYLSNTIEIAPSTTQTVNLIGTGFTPDSTVTLTGFPGTINTTTIVSPTQIDINVTATAATGTYDVVIANSNSDNSAWPGNGVGAFVVNLVTGTGPAGTYVESFESGLGNWTDSGLDAVWTNDSGGTPSTGTGPTVASVGTFYMFTEASNPNFPDKEFGLETSHFNVAQSISFDYHMYGTAMGDLEVQYLRNSVWTTVQTIAGQQQTNQGDAYLNQFVDLSPFQVEAVRLLYTSGANFTGDCALDNIQIISS